MTWCLIAAPVLLALWFLGPVLTPFVVAAVLARDMLSKLYQG